MKEMVLEYRGTKYYRDLQGRYYVAGVEAGNIGNLCSDGGPTFDITKKVKENSYLWHVLEGAPEVLEAKKLLGKWADTMIPKTAPQPAKRFLP